MIWRKRDHRIIVSGLGGLFRQYIDFALEKDEEVRQKVLAVDVLDDSRNIAETAQKLLKEY